MVKPFILLHFYWLLLFTFWSFVRLHIRAGFFIYSCTKDDTLNPIETAVFSLPHIYWYSIYCFLPEKSYQLYLGLKLKFWKKIGMCSLNLKLATLVKNFGLFVTGHGKSFRGATLLSYPPLCFQTRNILIKRSSLRINQAFVSAFSKLWCVFEIEEEEGGTFGRSCIFKVD